jgi:hypothetical protein
VPPPFALGAPPPAERPPVPGPLGSLLPLQASSSALRPKSARGFRGHGRSVNEKRGVALVLTRINTARVGYQQLAGDATATYTGRSRQSCSDQCALCERGSFRVVSQNDEASCWNDGVAVSPSCHCTLPPNALRSDSPRFEAGHVNDGVVTSVRRWKSGPCSWTARTDDLRLRRLF